MNKKPSLCQSLLFPEDKEKIVIGYFILDCFLQNIVISFFRYVEKDSLENVGTKRAIGLFVLFYAQPPCT
jgi:hypothetical protein